MTNAQAGTTFERSDRRFRRPAEILEAGDIGKAEKIRLLRQWEADLRALLVASEENMSGDGQGWAAERLRQVRGALDALGVEAEEAAGVPNKAGGA
jgi:hypothetical protein